jgi:hypothetical protein
LRKLVISTLSGIALVASVSSSAGSETTLVEIAQALKLFGVLEVEQKGPAIRSLMDHPRITHKMSFPMAMAVCSVQWDRPTAFNGVETVHITNRFSAQGYVLENPEKVCAEVGLLKTEDARIFLPGHMHLHFRGDF